MGDFKMKKIFRLLIIPLALIFTLMITTTTTYAYSGDYNVKVTFNESFTNGQFPDKFDAANMNFIANNYAYLVGIDGDSRDLLWMAPTLSNVSWSYNVLTITNAWSSDGGTTKKSIIFDDEGNWGFQNGGYPTLSGSIEITLYFDIPGYDNVSPVLDGQTAFVTDIDNPVSVATITSYISAYDETDGDLTHAIEMVDSARDAFIYELINWHNNELIDLEAFGGIDFLLDLYDEDDLESINFEFEGQILSKTLIETIFAFSSDFMYFNFDDNLLAPDDEHWFLYYYVIDSSGNGSILTVNVFVKDITDPIWNENKGTVSIGYSQTFNVEAYKSQLGVQDNYYQSNELTITVHSNAYTQNKTVPGTYNIVYRITDPSGNYTDATVKVTVVDDVAPTISGPTVITKPSTSILLLSDIKAQLTANDAIDGNLTSSIIVLEDNYTGKGHLVGNYTIVFKVSDSAGNSTTHTLTVQVKDNMPPIFYVKDGYFINVQAGISLTKQQIIDILILTGQLSQGGQGGMHVQTTYDEYTGNEDTPGIYAMSFRVTSPSGNESNHHVALNVMGEPDDDGTIIIGDPNWIEKNKTLLIALGVVVGIAAVVALNSNKPRRRRR